MAVSDPPRTEQSGAGRARARRRVSRRRYMFRRAGALVVLVLIAFGAARFLSAALGGSDRAAQGSSVPRATDVTTDTAADPATDGVVDSGPADGAGGAADQPLGVDSVAPVEAIAPPDTEPDEPVAGPPSQTNPAEVYIVGDSDAGTFGPYLQRLLDGTLITETDLNYKVSSGLSRPDFFDWFAELRRLLPEVAPDIVVVTFGGNDGQPLTEADGAVVTGMPESDTADWTAEYERRAGEMMDLLLEDDRSVIWVGIPNDDNPDVTARMTIQDQAAKAAAAARPGVVFIDTWTRFSGRDGGWAEFVIDPRDGQGKDVRASDGFHLNEVGAEILAIDIAQAIRDDLRVRGANI